VVVLGEPTAEFMRMGTIEATRATNPACDLENKNLIRDTNGRQGRQVVIFMESCGGSGLGIGMLRFKDVLNGITSNGVGRG
jgi:hypothetical protein